MLSTSGPNSAMIMLDYVASELGARNTRLLPMITHVVGAGAIGGLCAAAGINTAVTSGHEMLKLATGATAGFKDPDGPHSGSWRRHASMLTVRATVESTSTSSMHSSVRAPPSRTRSPRVSITDTCTARAATIGVPTGNRPDQVTRTAGFSSPAGLLPGFPAPPFRGGVTLVASCDGPPASGSSFAAICA